MVLSITDSSIARQMCNKLPAPAVASRETVGILPALGEPMSEIEVPRIGDRSLRLAHKGRRMLPIRLLAALILFLPLSLHRLQAQTAPLPQLQSADPFVADLFQRSGSTGMVVVVVRGNEKWMQSYGQTYPGSHQKPNADSLVRLCSLSKIMTTDLLVKLIADGNVSLSDPLQKFAPPSVTVPVRTVS